MSDTSKKPLLPIVLGVLIGLQATIYVWFIMAMITPSNFFFWAVVIGSLLYTVVIMLLSLFLALRRKVKPVFPIVSAALGTMCFLLIFVLLLIA